MTATTESAAPRTGSRVTARWRIVGWLMLTLALAFIALIVTVRSTLVASTGRELNDDVEQEVREFRSFAAEGRNPETAEPFSDVSTFFEVLLRRQQTASDEFLLGHVPADSETLLLPGRRTPPLEDIGLNPDGERFIELLTGEPTGILQTQLGEVRYARDEVRIGGKRGVFVVLAFAQPSIDDVNQITRLMAYIAVGSLAFATLLAWLAAGQILRPVRSVRRAAAEITEQDLTRRIPVEGNDDISELAITFNSMLDRLESAFAAEQRFVDDAAHELRTPITVIRGHLETMGSNADERESAVALVLTELERMSRIVSDLLALAKAERPDFVMLDREYDVADLTLEIDSKMQTLGDRRWHLTHVADGVAVLDAQRVTQAVLQLAQNAVEHTSAGSTIEFATTFTDDPAMGRAVAFAVTDDGPGVRPEDAPHIFDRFARAARSHLPHQRPGAGLGLAIVRAIADGHHGSVEVMSEPGHGATFTLLVPADHGPGLSTALPTALPTAHADLPTEESP